VSVPPQESAAPVRLCTEALDQLDERVARPIYDRTGITTGIVHFGVGGFHRSHEAMYLDQLMNRGQALDWGICGVGLMPGDKAMHDDLLAQDCLYTLMVRHGSGQVEPRVIGSIIDHLYAPDDPEAVLQVMTRPNIRVVSLTVTEGGYNIDAVTGHFDRENPVVLADIATGAGPTTIFGYVVEALRRQHLGLRRLTGP
jgi:mannitol 2-dehydrogenase